jgi:NADH-quinone oxidoreductase subunit H
MPPNVSLLALVIMTVVKGGIVIIALMTAFAYGTWLERRMVGRFQLRFGPNRVGPFGLLQPLADGVKSFFKEDFMPGGADRVPYWVAPALVVTVALTTFVIIPFGPPSAELFGVPLFYITNVNVGILFILAIVSIGAYGVILGGWASNSKYSLLGGLRSTAQLISYELGVGLSIIGVILLAGTLELTRIVDQQGGFWFGFLPRWNIFLQPLGFLLFVVGGIAETNRAPFDLPEAEHELTAGYQTEYGGMKSAMFYMAEYIDIFLVSAIATTLFLGGWHGPLAHQFPLLGVLWFLVKVLLFVFAFIWIRATLPRVRYDQLMDLGWKVILPLALLNLLLTAIIVILWPWLGGA